MNECVKKPGLGMGEAKEFVHYTVGRRELAARFLLDSSWKASPTKAEWNENIFVVDARAWTWKGGVNVSVAHLIG